MGSARIDLEATRTTPAALRRHERNATVLVRHQPEVACGTVTRSGEADLTVVTALSGIEHKRVRKSGCLCPAMKGDSLARISGSISLRPTRIAFLVRPADTASISRIMRWCACLWGGLCNPIIPVGRYPQCWRQKNRVLRKTDREVALDYMDFFEPDVLVEAQPGLAESIGYGALDESDFDRQLLSLDELFSSEGEYPPRFQFGLSLRDAYRDIFRTERQFVLRDAPLALIFNETGLSPLVETVFGTFPTEDNAQSFRDDFVSVFPPEEIDPTVTLV